MPDTEEKEKNASIRWGKVLIKVILTIVLVPVAIAALIIGIFAVNTKIQSDRYKQHCLDLFKEVCTYVSEHTDAYTELSEYEFSQTSDDENYHHIAFTGELQEQRDIVMKYVHEYATVENDNYRFKQRVAYYCIETTDVHGFYRIFVYYGKNIKEYAEPDEFEAVINDDIIVSVGRFAYA